MRYDVGLDLQNICVLIVEDNARNYGLLVRLLSSMGVKRIEWKQSGWRIPEFTQDAMPQVDLILLDIHLPDEDGYEVLDRLRREERFRETRIVAVTADISKANLARAQSAGFDGFLAKPIDVDRFPDQILRILKGEVVWELG